MANFDEAADERLDEWSTAIKQSVLFFERRLCQRTQSKVGSRIGAALAGNLLYSPMRTGP